MKYLALLLISLPAFGQFGAASRILSGTGAPVAAQCTVENNVGLVWARKDGADAGTTFYVCGATGVGTYGWELRGGAPGGGAALSTVGSVPFVTSSGVLGQSANFFWDNANARLGVGTNAPSQRVQIASGNVFISTVGQSLYLGGITDSGTDGMRLFNNGSLSYIDTKGGGLVIRSDAVFGSTERARFAATTGNLLLGTGTDDGTNRLQVAGGLRAISTTATGFRGLDLSTSDSTTPNAAIRWYGSDNFVKSVIGRNYILAESIFEVLGTDTNASTSTLQSQFSALSITRNRNTIIGPSPVEGNFRLDVNSSGSSGTLRVYDQTPTTGSTSLFVRAGAGQTGNLQTWQSAAAGVIAYVNSQGGFASNEFYNTNDRFYQNSAFVDVGSALLYRFSSTVLQGGTKDLSLSRASAGRLQVGDGGANANGQLLAQRMFLTSNTTNPHLRLTTTSFGFWEIYTDFNNTDSDLWFRPNGTATGSAFTNINNLGNWTFGGQGSAAFKIDVAASGSSGTTRIYDQTPTTGSTSLVVRAGAGQGSNNLTTWQNSGGTQVAAVTSAGDIYSLTLATTGNQAALTTNGIEVRSAAVAAWSSTTSWAGTKDLSLSRASANTLQVGDGSANSNGTILARIHTWANGTEGTCDATLRGQVVMVQGGAGVADTFRVCRKDAANAYAWTALY